MARFLPLLLCIAAVLPACARDEALQASATLPAQNRDPELRREESASAGASRRGADVTRRGVTDLGREAEKEEEEFLQRQKLPQAQQ